MPEGLEIPVKLDGIDKAQKQVDGLRSSVKRFFDDMKKTDEETGKAISASAGTALSALGGVTNGLGTAFAGTGGGFQQMQAALGRNVANSAAGVGQGLGGTLGTLVGGPMGGILGNKIGGFIGELAGGALNREIDEVEIPLNAAKQRVAAMAGMGGMFGIQFSDRALKRAVEFTEGFEKRGFIQSRRVLEMQVWR